MYINRVRVKNVGCFEELDIKFDVTGKYPGLTVILGDNATGKSTLLRSIALGLCDESSAASLMKESDSGYVRFGERRGKIIIDLIGSKKRRDESCRIETGIEKFRKSKIYIHDSVYEYERVRQETKPKTNFPWDRVFVAGYGAGRGTSGAGDIVGYSVINAVYNLFKYTEGLQNPELIISRLKKVTTRSEIIRILKDLLSLDRIELRTSGITVGAPWVEEMPWRALADGYKSTFLWVTDLLGWAFAHNPRISRSRGIKGIVLIDEIEQHLHATWQRRIMRDLKEQFPYIQFIVTTHSPLVASSIGPLSEKDMVASNRRDVRDKLVYLELQENNVATAEYLPSMRLRRIDQVLASRAFKYVIDEDPSVERVLREASILAGKKKRTRAEQDRYKRFCNVLEPILLPAGQTLIEREIESERYGAIIHELRKLDKEVRSMR